MTIDDFRERIVSLRPGGLSGMNGAGSGILGSSGTGADALMKLQRAAIEFTKSYKSNDNDDSVRPVYKGMIADIMVAAALGAITEQQADELVITAQQLMKERKDMGK